jgi:SAM-dependent methyltransferase
MLRTLLSRGAEPAPDLAPEGPADPILRDLIDRERVIDRFDASYLDDLGEILNELYGVTEENVRDHDLWPRLSSLWELSDRPLDEFSLRELPRVLIDDVGVEPERHSPKRADRQVQRRFSYVKTRSWRKAVGKRLGNASSAGESEKAIVNAVQREFSMLSGGKYEYEFEDLARPETGDPWTPLMIRLREQGIVSAEEPCLTIGPRWVGEIHYFRQVLGLKGTIGLDLFSRDDDLIKVGDMHHMPFEDNTFGLIYQRNTFDKSYDIRKALRECLRVLRDGGVLISDDCYDYTGGVSELSRTSIKRNDQLVRVLDGHVAEVVHDVEADSNEDWIERVGQLAVRIRK